MKRLADITEFDDLPEDPSERHEMIMNFVGQEIVGFRNEALERIFGELDRNDWEHLLPYDAKFFEDASEALDADQRDVARKLTERAFTHFMYRFLTMLSCDGRNHPLGTKHGLHYNWNAQVRYYPKSEREADRHGDVIEEHDLNEGELELSKYWNRWMRLFKDY